jgi:hypothetical protein
MVGPNLAQEQLSKDLRITGCPMEIQHRAETWRAIGQGFQYTAYATESDVLKVPLTTDQVCRKFEDSWGIKPDREQVAKDREIGQLVVLATREKLNSGLLPRSLLAEAEIDSNGWILQRRVIPIRNAFEVADATDRHKLIENYAVTAKALVYWGAFETGYAILDNFGINAARQVVVLDFGELTFDNSVAMASVRARLWAHDRGGCKVFEGETLIRYLSIMDGTFDERMINEAWAKTLNKTVERR